MNADAKPLRGLKVLDLTQAWAGPYCTMMLADAGADVVKIEPPGVGDHVRQWTVSSSKGESPHFIAVNRNKHSMTLNLKHPEGRKIFLRLAAQSDVIIENFRPGVMSVLGSITSPCVPWHRKPSTAPYRVSARPVPAVLMRPMISLFSLWVAPWA